MALQAFVSLPETSAVCYDMKTHQSCSPRSTLLQTCYCTAPGKAFHHGTSTLEHCPEMSAALYTAELSLQKESCPKASITAMLPLIRMRLPWSETLCWTIQPKMDVSNVWEPKWVVVGAPTPGRGTLQQCWCSITHDGFTSPCVHVGRGVRRGFLPWCGEGKGGFCVHIPSIHACGLFCFAFMLFLVLQSLELQELPGEGNSLQGDATVWVLSLLCLHRCRGTALPVVVSPSALRA